MAEIQENNDDKQKRREKLLELQMFDQQIKQLEDQMRRIEEQILEINTLIDSISELKTVKTGQEILVPVANGIFANAKIDDTKILKVNVGGGVVVEKTIDETINMLKDQIKSVEGYREEMFLELQKIVMKASELQADIIGG